jgi:RimJ/RimL family protein N-acetyltransferase
MQDADLTEGPDQPVGEPLDFSGARRPAAGTRLRGARVTLRPVDPELDAELLYAASHSPTGDSRIWTYLYDGPYPSPDAYRDSLRAQAASTDPLYFTILRHHTLNVRTPVPSGVCSYLAIVPEHGTIEIGNIWFSPDLQRTAAATEAIFLLACHAFDELGYRRLEWKCNALNAPSRNAAQRFGFRFEGVFRQHRVVKGRNRDTAWFAITDERWPHLRDAFTRWLSPANLDSDGVQRRSLSSFVETAPGVDSGTE